MAQQQNNFQQIWAKTSLVQRVLLMVILLACGAATVALIGWAREPHMALLYTGLEPDEASRIVDKVRDAGVQFELADGGTTVRVPAADVYSLRLTMASSGLPEGGHKGYKILDDAKIGTSPARERINYIRAIEGEIAKSIIMLSAVTYARVHIALPENTLFKKAQSGTATVALKIRGAWSLGPGNVAAIVNMVAGAVEGLQPENVVVVDEQSNLLSGEGQTGEMARSNNVLDYRARVEQYFSDKAESMLAAVLGPGRASVRVSAEIDTISQSQTTTLVPGDAAMLSEKTETSSTTPGDGDGAPPTTETENIDNTYAVSQTIERQETPAGQVTSLTVAVLVDLSAPAKAPAAEGEEPAPRRQLVRRDVPLQARARDPSAQLGPIGLCHLSP